MTRILLIIIILLLLVAIGIGGKAMLQQKNPNDQAVVPTAPAATLAATPTPTAQGPTIPAGWQTYTNTKYGFTIAYPPSYKALTDKDNLYGWPKAVVLFYGGGQSYDIAVEVWATEAEYKQKYPRKDLAVYQINGQFLTLADQTEATENKAIIATFQLTK